MSRRALFLLLAALAVLGVLAVLSGGPEPDRDAARGAPLLEGLAAALNDIHEVRLTSAGNTVVATLRREDGRWQVVERDHYPADVGRLRSLLLQLAEARLIEEKTADPAFYDRLAVSDVAGPDARGMQVDLRAGERRWRVILGDPGPAGGDTRYARRAGEATSWLVGGQLDPGRDTGTWLDQTVLDIEPGRIHAVTLTHPGQRPLRLARASREVTDFTVADIPTGRSLRYATIANGIGAVPAALTLEDVQPRDSLPADPGKPIVARFETFDGLVVEFSGWPVADGVRFTVLASVDDALARRHAPDGGAEASPAPGEAAAAEAARINERVAGWVYTLPAWKTEQLTRRMADLLEPAGK